MFRSLVAGRVLTALLAGGILAIAQLSGPATVTASPAIEQVDYTPDVVTHTDVWVNRHRIRPGQPDTAHAQVSAETGRPHGTVTFTFAGHEQTVALRGGSASWSLPTDGLAPGRYEVTAHYNGADIYKESEGSTYVTVTTGGGGSGNGNGNGNGGGNGQSGGSGSGNGNGNGNGNGSGSGNGANRPGTTQGSGSGSGAAGSGTSSGDLPGTGSDENTILFTLIGLGLLGLGATTLAGRRRILR